MCSSILREMPMESFPAIFFYFLLLSFSIFDFSTAADFITQTQSLIDGQTLVSSNQTFELGFFSPGDSKNRYLGIWLKKFPDSVLWVANRENPIKDSPGVFTIAKNGNLVLLDGTNSTIWSSNSSGVSDILVVQLLESGNLVVRDKSDENSENYIWQSFEFPCDTLLPGMKIGWNSNMNKNQYLVSWKNDSDPSPGDFTWGIDNIGLPQPVLRKGTQKIFRSGIWNGIGFSGTTVIPNAAFNLMFVYDGDKAYYTYELNDHSVITRFTLSQSGMLQRLILNDRSTGWALMYTLQNDPCDDYGRCGKNSICSLDKTPFCDCLDGFTPKSQKEWDVLNWASGCVRRMPLDCQKGDGFVKLGGVKLPDMLEFWMNKSMNIKECEVECLKNCSCTAYANSDISDGGSGCLIWLGDLVDIREFGRAQGEQVVYIRLSASEIELMDNSREKKKRIVIMVVVSTVSGILVLGLVFWWHIIREKRRKERGLETKKEDLELPLFDLVTIATATDNFSSANMIGEGGFGPVYKGEISMEREIAVKRLSKNSGQGVEEFKNEVMLIAKLQHRNLVKLLGCCIEGEERMLIYEYMPNKSLDYFIFDQNRSELLDWQKRFDIVMGIARGLLYLHQDSRLRVVHRDLKTSNILLDSKMNPKISDFGLARILGGDQMEAKTKRVIGTYGYMSPEYAIDGKFSAKSDVFSLGVLLLEMVSGKKNRGFHHTDHHHNLLGHAWLLWNEGKALELTDPCLGDSYVESQVLRCIQVGLLCVQKHQEDRPDMSSVVFMLGNEGATRPQPKQPGFFIERSSIDVNTPPSEQRCPTENAVTITMLEAR